MFRELRVRVDLERCVFEMGRGVRDRSLVDRRRSERFPLLLRDGARVRDSALSLRFLARNT